MSEKVEITEARIVEVERVEGKEPLVIMSFVGPGLVGGIAATHIIDQLKMRPIAYVQSKYIPASAVFVDGRLRYPFRIHSDEEGRRWVVVCESPLPIDGSYSIASTLIDWIEKKQPREIVVLDGIPVRSIPAKRESFCVAEIDRCRECERKGVKVLSAGIIHGIAGSVLNECLVRRIVGVAFLTPTVTISPDSAGAAELIRTLNNVYDLNIALDDLVDKANEIRKRLRRVVESHHKMRKAEEKRRGIPQGVYI